MGAGAGAGAGAGTSASVAPGGFTRFKSSTARGLRAEDRFLAWAKARAPGARVFPATYQDNTRRHVDFVIVWPDGKHLSIDVKAQKRARRGEDTREPVTHTWLEMHGAQHFNPGWVHGDADAIAMEKGEGDDAGAAGTDWCIISRLKLARWARTTFGKATPSKCTQVREEAIAEPMKKMYTRRDYEALLFAPLADVFALEAKGKTLEELACAMGVFREATREKSKLMPAVPMTCPTEDRIARIAHEPAKVNVVDTVV